MRQRAYQLLERGRRHGVSVRLFDISMVILIIANVVAIVIGTVPTIAASYGTWLTLFDRACVAVFIAEYVARLWSAPEHPLYKERSDTSARWHFAATPLMLLDLAGILPFFMELVSPEHTEGIRILCLLRFLRLARYSPALATIGRVVAGERRALFACVIIFIGLLLATAAIIYLVEGSHQPDGLGDLPSAMWWAVVMMTKLGNTDVSPHTALGKFAAAVILIIGIGFFALPVAIIGRGFAAEIRRRDFVVTFGMVARVPLFAHLPATAIAELVGLLQARKVAAGTVVIRKGDVADAMYLIASGQVDVATSHGAVRLSDGEFFGEMALLARGRRSATVTARRATELLVLDSQDFDQLMERNADVAETVKRVAHEREIINAP